MSRVGAFIFPDRKKNIRQKEVKYHLNCRAVVKTGLRGISAPPQEFVGSEKRTERELDPPPDLKNY